MIERATVWYRAILRLLPAERRRRDGEAMVVLFRSLLGEAHRAGGAFAVLRTFVRSAVDVVVVAARERRSGLARGALMDTLRLDLRQGLRSLRRRPGFAVLAGATFALGIGATTAIFSVVDAVLLRDLPYAQPDRLVRLWGTSQGELNREGTLSYLNAMDVEARNRSFTGIAAYDEWLPNLTRFGEPELLSAATVNTDFFDILGVRPAVGRFFTPEEDDDGRDRVVVLSHALWQRLYAGDRAVLGESLMLNGVAHTVVGVAPADFEDPKLSGPRWPDPQLWRPLGFGGLPLERQPARGSTSYTAIARLAPGVTLDDALAELSLLSTQLELEYPEQNTGDGMTAIPLHESIVGDVRASLLLLLAAVAVLLTIAAANVGSLLLGRAAERRREVAMRIALGASRVRAVRQFLIETMVLAIVGGAVGVAMAMLAAEGLVTLGSQFVPRGTDMTLNATVFGVSLGVTVLTGLVCGLAPALSTASTDPGRALRDGHRGTTGGSGALRLRAGLIVAEVSLALLLLVGAGLLSKSLWRLMNVDVGIEPAGLLTFELAPPLASYPDAAALDAFYAVLLERLRALPGVERAAAVNIAPLTGGFDGNSVYAADQPRPAPGEGTSAEVRTVTPDYFAAASLGVRRGRLLEARDRAGTAPVTVISEALADRLWPGEDAVGRQLVLLDTAVQVIGVVADVKHMRLDEPAPPMLYVARAQSIVPWQIRRATLVVAARDEAASLAPAVRAEVRALDADLPIANMRTMKDVVASSAAPPRFRTLLLGSFAIVALLLATLGIYGVVSYSVAQRSREMAIRMALGARAEKVTGLVVREGLSPVLAGLTIGLVAAFALSRVLAALLFEVTTLDASVFLAVPMLMLAIAAAASVGPARRATRVDPMTVLRED